MFLAVVTLFTLPVAAQQVADTTLNRTVVVEQEYNPDIRDADKVNVLPRIEAPTVGRRAAEYDLTLMPSAALAASAVAVPSTQESRPKAPNGYVRAGYGNRGNADFAAGYRFTPSRRDRIGIALGLNGMNGKLDDYYAPGSKWQAHYYRTRAGVDYVHGFDVSELSIAADFDLHNFNLPVRTRTLQKFLAGEANVGFRSTDRTLPMQYHVEGGYRIFRRRDPFSAVKAMLSENRAAFRAGALGRLADTQYVGLDLAFTYYAYSYAFMKDYALLGATPYYLMDGDNLRIKLGAHLDYSAGFDAGLRVSPDALIQYTFADSYVVYAQAGGGVRPNDFRRQAELHPYGEQLAVSPLNPSIAPSTRLRDTYERVNASLGFRASPADGLWLNLYGGYQRLKNDVVTDDMLIFYQIDPANYYGGAEVRYAYKNIFSLTAAGIYRSWKADTPPDEAGNPIHSDILAMKPVFEGDIRVEATPVSPLQVHVGMKYIARKRQVDPVEGSFRKAPVSNLYLGADYALLPAVILYARVDNLLNRKYETYYGIYAPRFNFLGGIRFRF
jgi:hypothetical protein